MIISFRYSWKAWISLKRIVFKTFLDFKIIRFFI